MDVVSDVKFSVLLPLVRQSGEWFVLFEVRNPNLKEHGGEISFPGGAREHGESLEYTAIRETAEELGMPLKKITVIKSLKGTKSIKGYWIDAFVGVLEEGADINPSTDEVESVFTVPLSFLKSYCPEIQMISAEYCEPIKSYVYEYEGHKIWGITARILKNFINEISCFEEIYPLLVE